MNEGPKRDWIILILVVLAGIGLGAIQNRARSVGSVDPVTQLVRNLLQPGVSMTDGVADNVDEFWRGVRDAKSLRTENQRLKDQLNAVAMYSESEKRLLDEIDRLKGLLKLDAKGKTKVFGSIIGFTPYDNQFMIDVGAKQGIRPNLPVVTSKGLIGIVSTVEQDRAQVLLLFAPSVSIIGVIESSPVRVGGLIKGAVGGRLVVNVLDKADIVAGTEVVTSGYSLNIPPGIPIGTILEVHEDEQFGEIRAYVLPYAKLTMAQEVAVLK